MAAKLLVHLLGEWKGQAEIVEGRGRGREWGENGEGIDRREMEMH